MITQKRNDGDQNNKYDILIKKCISIYDRQMELAKSFKKERLKIRQEELSLVVAKEDIIRNSLAKKYETLIKKHLKEYEERGECVPHIKIIEKEVLSGPLFEEDSKELYKLNSEKVKLQNKISYIESLVDERLLQAFKNYSSHYETTLSNILKTRQQLNKIKEEYKESLELICDKHASSINKEIATLCLVFKFMPKDMNEIATRSTIIYRHIKGKYKIESFYATIDHILTNEKTLPENWLEFILSLIKRFDRNIDYYFEYIDENKF